jgi:hypothetical protein
VHPLIPRAILVTTSLWHAAAAWHFTFFPQRTLARTTQERPVNRIATELFRFLGSLNAAIALFALLLTTLPASSIWIALTGMALANLSQFAVDWRVSRLGLVQGPMFKMIFWGDGIVFALNLMAACLCFGLSP